MENILFNDIKNAIFKYNDVSVKNLVEKCIQEGINPLKVINVLTNSISIIGDKFEQGELWIPELMMAAGAMQSAMKLLEKELIKQKLKRSTYGKVVIGTVYGDLHDIGKNMVATMLSANSFEVIDLGVNVDSIKFIEAVNKYKPDILAMSALLTTTAPEQEKVILALKKAGMKNKVKVMVGGAPITQEFAEKIGANGYEPTAVLAVKLAKKFMEIKD